MVVAVLSLPNMFPVPTGAQRGTPKAKTTRLSALQPLGLHGILGAEEARETYSPPADPLLEICGVL